jgi:DNA processing protein
LYKYEIALSLVNGIGHIKARTLIAYCGSAEAIFKENRQNLLKIPDIGEYCVKYILSQREVLDRAEEEIEFIRKNDITTFFYLDDSYPKRLKHCEDSPIIIYFKGKCDFNNQKVISIVGTRNATDYGKSFCRSFIEELSRHQLLIISGLAYGIDISAHKEAISNNLSTVGVLGHGLDRIYPGVHRSTAEKMLQNGGLITEFISNTKPDRENFPMRNRIIAGLSDAVIVVEAAETGGALITADIANSYNRDVFALPGRINDEYSSGCNKLIKINKAALIQSAKDLVYIMGWEAEPEKKAAVQKQLFVELTREEEKIIAILKADPETGIDMLAIQAEMSMSKLSAVLLNLEFKGIVKCLPGKRYKLV